METQLNINKIIKTGKITNELDFERALIADRKLRVLSKENTSLKSVRKELRNIIANYENKHWSNSSNVNENKLKESDIAELVAEKERIFIETRKSIIKLKLKKYTINQQEFGIILGHNSKSYMSELMNGICPFSLTDLIVINRLLKIDLTDLIPTFLPQNQGLKVRKSIERLGKPNLKLSKKDFAFA
jgi:predicted metalloprotease with PDZ domain